MTSHPSPAVETLSIVVPSFNQARFLGQTLESLFAQADPALQVIVVDGGSTDGSVKVIEGYADRIAWWVSEPDGGQSAALNKGFARATGQWLGWLNSDDLLLPGALAALRDHVQAAPQRQWWIGGGYFIDDGGRRFRDHAAPVGLDRAEQLADWQDFWFAQPSTFFRRDLFDRAGASIREDLHYAMDLDLWLRFMALAPPGFIERELSVYRHHVQGKTHAMSIEGEAEIVRVVAAHLGLEHALQRVRRLAAERDTLQAASQRVQQRLRPLFELNRRLHSIRQLFGRSK